MKIEIDDNAGKIILAIIWAACCAYLMYLTHGEHGIGWLAFGIILLML